MYSISFIFCNYPLAVSQVFVLVFSFECNSTQTGLGRYAVRDAPALLVQVAADDLDAMKRLRACVGGCSLRRRCSGARTCMITPLVGSLARRATAGGEGDADGYFTRHT
jgi:hypothetical protein